jgi:adenylate cyclase
MAAASRQAAVEVALAQGTTEREAALFWASAAEYLLPNTTRVVELAFEAHLRRQVREIYIGATDIVAGRTPGAQEISVAFADLVGFTRLGQAVTAEDLGKVARRLEETAAGALEPGVSIIKTIGDAVMLTCPQPAPLLETLLALIDAARALPDGFPQVRAGVATGAALERAGDWFGGAVNLASRITGIAEPDSVVAAESVHLATPEGYHWKYLGQPALKGIDKTPPLYRVTRA